MSMTESSLMPLDPPFNLRLLTEQYLESNLLARIFTEIIQQTFPHIKTANTVSSFASGTNNHNYDIDIVVENASFGVRDDELLDQNSGEKIINIKNLDEVLVRDAAGLLFDTPAAKKMQDDGAIIDYQSGKISEIINNILEQGNKADEIRFLDPEFISLKAWDNAAGVVLTFSFNYRSVGRVPFDITLYNNPNNKHFFGVDHTYAFKEYIENSIKCYGEVRTIELLNDIRRLKSETKSNATNNGNIDYTKKVPGYVIESLFTQLDEPIPYNKMISMIASYQMPDDELQKLPKKIMNQRGILVHQGKKLDTILKMLTKGGYENIKSIALKSI